MLRRRFYKDKTFMIILLVCLVAATVIAIGSVAINKNNDNNQNLVDLNEKESESQTDDNEPANSQVETKDNSETQATEDVTSTNIDTNDSNPINNNVAKSLNFTSSSKLYWPIEKDGGNEVILDFNMENTVYFATLNKYQCNPAILIQADTDTPVLASADGVVKAINEDEELGTSIVVSLGNNYELTYGQLKNVQVKEGQAIKAKDVIGYVNDPTKYYLVEGSNLYYELTSNGEPIDPLDYLTY